MSLKLILVVMAIIFFIIAGLGVVPKYRVEWFGAACLAAAWIIS